MSRGLRCTSPGLGSLAAFLSAVILPLAGPAHAKPGLPVNGALPTTDRMPLCSNVLEAREAGYLRTPLAPDPGAELSITAGLWVGAEADRGAGVEQLVSTAMYELEFYPVDDTQLPGLFGDVRRIYADTSMVLVPHEALGLRVTQVASPGQRPGYGGFIRFHFDVRNISQLYRPPGWDMENVYLGMFADPDVGLVSADVHPWSDDQAAYALTADGGLGYAWDEPGNADDTSTRVGILLPGQEPHSFQVWAGPEGDEAEDTGKYALLRGDGHDVQTIDPPSVTPNDHRILMSIGPFTLPRGAVQSLDVAIVCGDAIPSAQFEIARRVTAATPTLAVAAPNPVSRGASGVHFPNLAGGAKVSVYEPSGRLVTTLTASASGEAGWDLASRGRRVPAGVYLYRIVGSEGSSTGKLVVLR